MKNYKLPSLHQDFTLRQLPPIGGLKNTPFPPVMPQRGILMKSRHGIFKSTQHWLKSAHVGVGMKCQLTFNRSKVRPTLSALESPILRLAIPAFCFNVCLPRLHLLVVDISEWTSQQNEALRCVILVLMKQQLLNFRETCHLLKWNMVCNLRLKKKKKEKKKHYNWLLKWIVIPGAESQQSFTSSTASSACTEFLN